jgi:hypothetical protein
MTTMIQGSPSQKVSSPHPQVPRLRGAGHGRAGGDERDGHQRVHLGRRLLGPRSGSPPGGDLMKLHFGPKVQIFIQRALPTTDVQLQHKIECY